ncbi:MAG TPA: hypothetical protein VFZ91_02565 [Allosphingosinicella sp.]
MRKLLIAAVVTAQIAGTAPPVFAAELPDQAGSAGQRQGAFAGARIRVPLGSAKETKVRAGLTVAPLRQGFGPDGSLRIGFGPGLELGMGEGGDPALSLAGQRMDRLMLGRSAKAPGGTRAGVSTLGWVAIGVGAVALVLVALVAACSADDDCPPSE